MNTMSTLSLFTSQILLWNYLFLLALKKKNRKKKNIFLIIAHRAFPRKKTKLGEKRRGSEGGRGIHSVSLAYEKRLTTI